MTNETPVSLGGNTLQREVIVAALSLGFGLLVLPFAVYLVGQRLLGDYAANSGAMALAESIWLDLFTLRWPAWLLVLSPYITVQLVRWMRRVWRPESM